MRVSALFLLSLLLVSIPRCARNEQTLILASTTSTQDSGLFDVLIPAFHAAHEAVRVQVIAVGSGEALALGRRRDADVLLVHSPAEELAFMRDGHGVRRLPVMYNDYVIVGPAADPAGVRQAGSAAAAMSRIAAAGAAFVTRGDSSGTHRRELTLWRAAADDGTIKSVPDRIDAGQGMAETLGIASERAAYTLADRSTFLALSAGLQTVVLYEGDAALRNDYSVITVAGASPLADTFADWLTSAEGARIISRFGMDQFGRPLFLPARDSLHD